MPEVVFRQVAYTPERTHLPEAIREVNESLRGVCALATQNYRSSIGELTGVVLENTTLTIWMPFEAYRVEEVALRVSTGTADATPRIDGVAMGVAGGTPVGVTTTATRYEVTSANDVPALGNVDVVVASMSAGAWLTIGLKVRRMA